MGSFFNSPFYLKADMSKKEQIVVVFNKLPDQEAITTYHTLTELMGYEEVLSGLNRAVYFKVLSENDDEQHKLLNRVIKRTTIFLNPNKEFYRILDGDLNSLFETDNGVVNSFVLVKNRDGGDDLADQLHKLWGFEEILSIERHILWNLQFYEGVENIEGLVEEMTILKSRERGLLANPHSQEYVIL